MQMGTCKRHKYMGMRTHDIVEDIIMDILIVLPVKSLLRFKCVAKFWKALISQPNFKKMHLNFHAKNKNSQKLLIGQTDNGDTFYFYSSCLSSVQIVKDIQRLDWPLSTKPLHGRVYCCCNGLFLIGLWSQHGDLPSMLLIWNPSTRESIVLPDLEFQSEESAYGLGYDSTSDDFKVVSIDTEDQVGEILALKYGSWRNIDETSGSMPSSVISDRVCLAFIHGAFHWLGGFPPKKIVVRLNISSEMYGEIPYPEIVHPLPVNSDLGISVLGGMLCIHLNDQITFNVWLMKQYGVKESWTKSFSIPLNWALNWVSDLIPIYMFSDDEVLVNYMHSAKMMHRIIGSIGLSNRIWPLDSDEIDAYTIQDGFVYSESLMSPNLRV